MQMNFTIKAYKSLADCAKGIEIAACSGVQVYHDQIDNVELKAFNIDGSTRSLTFKTGADDYSELIIENMAGNTVHRFCYNE